MDTESCTSSMASSMDEELHLLLDIDEENELQEIMKQRQETKKQQRNENEKSYPRHNLLLAVLSAVIVLSFNLIVDARNRTDSSYLRATELDVEEDLDTIPHRRLAIGWYNSVNILMDDNNLVKGSDGDGQVYFESEWDGSGRPATPKQEKRIPPVLATETEAGSPNADLTVVGRAANPSSKKYNPITLHSSSTLIEGATVQGALSRTDRNPIAGGIVIDIDSPNTKNGDEKLAEALAAAKYHRFQAAGKRSLPPFDCEGLTGYNCCLMIKATVKDADIHGNSIQCHLNYVEDSAKGQYLLKHIGQQGADFYRS